MGNDAWARDTNWRQHMSPVALKPTSPPPVPALSMTNKGQQYPYSNVPTNLLNEKKSFLEAEFEDDIGDMEWVGGWHDDFQRSISPCLPNVARLNKTTSISNNQLINGLY